MHKEVVEWIVNYVWRKHPELFSVPRILECGSLNVNGSIQPLFKYEEYVGVDWIPGKGVSRVCLVHEYRDKPDGYFDLVISTEMLEHDPYWQKSLRRMTELLKEKGNLILTWASGDREPHEIECSPQKGYYRNLGIDEILPCIEEKFEKFEFFNARSGIDTYLLGRVKK